MTNIMGWSDQGSVSLAVTTTSARVALPKTTVENVDPLHNRAELRQSRQARITVRGGTLVANDVVFVKYGDSSVVATINDGGGIAMLAGLVEIHEIPIGTTHVAAISTANGCTIQINIGREG